MYTMGNSFAAAGFVKTIGDEFIRALPTMKLDENCAGQGHSTRTATSKKRIEIGLGP